MTDRTLVEIFDEVMRCPEARRGMVVLETCRLLAERVKSRFPAEEYQTTMRSLEKYYLDQFLHTASLNPQFPDEIRRGIQRYL